MQPRPAIAILTPGILTALGLKSILEKLIPMAEVDAFDDARALEESGMERYFHFFVATRCFVGHSALFAQKRRTVHTVRAHRKVCAEKSSLEKRMPVNSPNVFPCTMP